jgi:hypothetical protein
VQWVGQAPELSCVEEGLVHGDELAIRDPAGFAVLDRYARTHRPDVAAGVLDAAYRLRFRSRSDFVDNVLYPATADPDRLRAWIVTFNAGYDLSRLLAPHLPVPASGWEARAGFEEDASGKRRRRQTPSRFAGGFSLPLWEYEKPSSVWHENRQYRPRLGIRHLGTRKNLVGWIRGTDEHTTFTGHFLDTLTLAAALTGESQSLETACRAFGFDYQEELDRLGVYFTKGGVDHEVITEDYVSYNRADTAATARLCGALLAECAALGIATQPTRLFSTASIAKDTLDRLGVQPLQRRQPDFDPAVMGFAMTALYGGRAECHIRRTPVPVTVCDFTSLYPTVSILLGLQDFLTCAEVQVTEVDPAEVESWLARIDVETLLTPATWGQLRAIALVDPAEAVLPVRADWHANGTLGIGLNRIASASEPLWYGLPDLAASTVLTGHPPKVLKVLRFDPLGAAPGLRRMRLGETIELDLRRGNLYRALIDERGRIKTASDPSEAERGRLDQFLTIVANSVYGITAEMNVSGPLREAASLNLHGLRTFALAAEEHEQPGDFFFAPQAALTTAGGRLMLALLERLVTDAGGTWCFADTDSFAIVSTLTGGSIACESAGGTGQIRALSFAEVDAIRRRIHALSPYDPTAVADLLKVEKVNFEGNSQARSRRELWAYAVAAKKYALFVRQGQGVEVLAALDEADEDEDHGEGLAEIVDRREHGLGFLRSPIDPKDAPDARAWITSAWAHVLAGEAGAQAADPEWFGLPKMSRNATLTTPRLLRAFSKWNAGRSVTDAIKPFNFLNRVFVDRDDLPEALRGLALAAPYDEDPRRWLGAAYFDLRTKAGGTYRITTTPIDPEVGDDGTGRIRVETYADLVRQLPLHPESKSLGPDGLVCGPQTRGLLARRTVRLGLARHIGKETTQLDFEGLEGAWPRVRVFDEPEVDVWAIELLPKLRARPTGDVALALAVHPSTVKRWKSGDMRPRPRHIADLARLLRN